LTFDQVDLEKAKGYSCEDADVTLQLSQLLFPKLTEGGFKDLFDQVEMPLLVVLARMEMNGVKIDIDLLNEFSKEMEINCSRGRSAFIPSPERSSISILPATGEDPLR